MVDRIAQQCTFDAMKNNSSAYWMMTRDGELPNFLRKGQIGGWKDYFTPELIQRFEKEVLGKLDGSGLQFDLGRWFQLLLPQSMRGSRWKISNNSSTILCFAAHQCVSLSIRLKYFFKKLIKLFSVNHRAHIYIYIRKIGLTKLSCNWSWFPSRSYKIISKFRIIFSRHNIELLLS